MTNLGRIALMAGVLLASADGALAQSERMNFFLTSEGPGDGAKLGGLQGADAHCAALASRAGVASNLTWRAYLSTQAKDDQPAVNARDRIGTGPWYNFKGELVAENLDQLHGENKLGKEGSLTEKGEVTNGRGDTPNRHDILTGSQADGTAYPPEADATCNNWTSNGEGSARLGHHDRVGGGENPTSWNSAHLSRGCSQQNLQATGGNGLFYCFAVASN
jgi:hypothetical protein